MTSLSLVFSPCPNDTFIFDAFVNDKIKKTFHLTYRMLDIEKLNKSAISRKFDIIKISVPLYSKIYKEYQLLTAGSALGENNGPLLVAGNQFDLSELKKKLVAIPGKNTTANFLLDLFYPNLKRKRSILFSEIINHIKNGSVSAGLLIHETRFTYKSQRLICLADFGKMWKKKTGKMLPLGVIAVRRNLSDELKKEINRKISESIKFAQKNPTLSKDFIQKHAAEMDVKVQRKHINLYVNNYSVNMGEKGKRAVEMLLKLYSERQKINCPDFKGMWVG
ncbi:MAG: hypothetical protein A3H98_09590 [Bacteroidetes bacterium RIFCSPLOWO2_02_FULL_36_8]|nr:MAG: hypothetical protein A3H98_09590 [Bacteroidetes bacterium RIFCSPLOWO2_02_FULL_36_8]OFY69280.1 MAG: hypothetical protein A3G23_02315 [Bacteroidetes bacterium RIFCSPLOWO2_12_FULL_37_12]